MKTRVGVIQLATDQPVLQLMSMTKLVVSIAALQLVEAGKLSLDDPAVVAKYLPELAELPILTAVEDGKAVTQKATKQTTLRHLLTHTSGSGYDAMVPLLGEWAKLNNAQTVIGADLSVDSFKLPLLFEPGQGWNYSLGLDWGGVLIERVTGQSLEKYFQQHIFKPLGITTLTFNPGAEHFAKLQQVVTHNPTDNSLMIFPGIRDCSGPDAIKGQASGGAGLYGTARDYLRLLQGVMASSKSAGGILTPDSVKLLFTNQLPPGPDGTFQGQYDFARFIPHIDAKLIDGGKLTHSLGGFVCTEECAHGRKKDSLWWEGIYKTFYWLDPATGVTVGTLCVRADRRACSPRSCTRSASRWKSMIWYLTSSSARSTTASRGNSV